MKEHTGPATDASSAFALSARVSNSFFTGIDPDHTRNSHPLCLIPLLLQNTTQQQTVQQLCSVLGRRGHNSLVCHVEEPDGEPYRGLASRLPAQADQQRYCLLPLLSAHSVLRHRFDHLVMLVPADLEALCLAYRHIKFLAARQATEIGVIIVGPGDPHEAWRYFRKLAVGTLRYLDVALLNLGFVPSPAEEQQAGGDSEIFLMRIGERLVRSDFYTELDTRAADQNECR